MTTVEPRRCACGKLAAPQRNKCWTCAISRGARQAANQRRNAKRQRDRLVTLDAYGGRCVRCGETDTEVLVLDHVNDDGADHRRSMGNQGVYTDLTKRGFPPDIQVLCANCNLRKERRRYRVGSTGRQ